MTRNPPTSEMCATRPNANFASTFRSLFERVLPRNTQLDLEAQVNPTIMECPQDYVTSNRTIINSDREVNSTVEATPTEASFIYNP